MYLCIHVDGYNQSLCSVDIDAEDGEVEHARRQAERRLRARVRVRVS